MTLQELDKMIEQRLAVHPSPVIPFADLCFVVGVPRGSWWSETRLLPANEKPPMFRAGGSDHLMTANAAEWCKGWVRRPENAKRYRLEAA